MNPETIAQAFVFVLAFGCGAFVVSIILNVGKKQPATQDHMKRRNELLEDNNSILRIIASCHVDAKRRQSELDYKAEKEAKAASQEPMSLCEIADLPPGSVGKLHQRDAKAVLETLIRCDRKDPA
jgi:hypothetical protein